MLSTRELAGTIWLLLFVVWALTQPAVRGSVRSILRTLLNPKLVALLGTVIASLAFLVWLLWREGRWDITMLYDTIVFVAVGGIGTVSSAATRGVTYDGRFFARTVLVNFEVMALFAFLSDFFPFNFWVEFLVVIPVTTLLVLLVIVSERQKGAEQVHRLLSGLQGAVGLLLLGYVIFRSIVGYQQLLTMHSLSELMLPFVLSLLFLPVLVVLCALFAYEDAFLHIGFKSGQPDALLRWKKRRLMTRFGLNLPALQAFRRSPSFQIYAWVKSAGEAQDVIREWSHDEAGSTENAFFDG